MRESPDQRQEEIADEQQAVDTLLSNFQILTNPAHIRLLQILQLRHSPTPINAITEQLEQSRPLVSKRLELMRIQGIVESRLIQNMQYYSLTLKGIMLADLAGGIGEKFLQETDIEPDQF